jgi:2-(1,2-epoxy-1,2-dihydrophenyl)acetyl-CoA isomerase
MNATSDTTSITLRRDGAIAHLRFSRPRSLNAIDAGMAQRLRELSHELAADASVRAVVMSGEGRAFVAGGDLPSMHARPDAIGREIIEPLHRALQHLAALDAPVIAAVHGAVAGAGMSLMLAADFAIAAEGTMFKLAYLGIGASCDGGASFALPRVVGLRRALEIALLNESFDANEASRLGLVNRVVPAQELEAATNELAQRLAAGPTRAIGRVRRLMRQSFDASLAEQLDAERAAFEASTTDADFDEGLSAFIAKRAPKFEGR